MPEEVVKIVEEKKAQLKGYTLIEGFPGLGLVGIICSKYLVEKLKMEEIGYIDSKNFLPVIRIHKGIPVRPARIFMDRKKKIAVLLCEQLILPKVLYALRDAIVNWTKKKGFSRVISINGIRAEEGISLYGIAANRESLEELKKHKVEVIEEGVTTGLTSLLLLAFKDSNIEAFSLLGNVHINADYKASAEVLKKLNEILKLNVDVRPLMKEAKELEKAITQHIAKMQSLQEEEVKRLGHAPMYT
ncbi:MAG: proteasome assembly chaperone family protein [Candidatus Diapherotrites archaeon]|nr:proteasome assembly chaperone family protein [Candidatus Diapherotrites archaeon]